MRLSKSTLSSAFVATSLALRYSVAAVAFEPSYAVLGNIDALEEMSPQVVFSYLTSCAKVTDFEFPEGLDCLFENYIDLQFPASTWGDVCSPPNVTLETIMTNVATAAGSCPDFYDLTLIETVPGLLMKVFLMESCWTELCERDDIIWLLESEYIETCIDVDLPYPLEIKSMFPLEDNEDDAILTCMLDFIMEVPPAYFGFEGSTASSCYPPGHENIAEVCPSVLALSAYEPCSDLALLKFNDGVHVMSLDYEMSMKTADDDEMVMDMELLDKFCDILERLSTPNGLACLDKICDSGEMDRTPTPSALSTPMPTFSPSSIQTLAPSKLVPTDVPSETPIAAPSVAPSFTPPVAHSSSPSSEPPVSAEPSFAPAVVPSAKPSFLPSTAPSTEPSESPSAAPTLSELQFFVNIEVVAGFAVNTSASDVPTHFREVVEGAIMEAFNGQVNATVLTIDGTAVTRRLRRLENTNMVDVEVSVEAEEECYVSDCTRFARNLIASLGADIAESVEDGSMTAYLQQEAATKKAGDLKDAVVNPDSYRLVRSDLTLVEPVTINNPDIVAPITSSGLVPTVTILGLSFLLIPLFEL